MTWRGAKQEGGGQRTQAPDALYDKTKQSIRRRSSQALRTPREKLDRGVEDRNQQDIAPGCYRSSRSFNGGETSPRCVHAARTPPEDHVSQTKLAGPAWSGGRRARFQNLRCLRFRCLSRGVRVDRTTTGPLRQLFFRRYRSDTTGDDRLTVASSRALC